MTALQATWGGWPCLWCRHVSPTRRGLGRHQDAVHGDVDWQRRYDVRVLIARIRRLLL